VGEIIAGISVDDRTNDGTKEIKTHFIDLYFQLMTQLIMTPIISEALASCTV
jgi:hypothetical protein